MVTGAGGMLADAVGLHAASQNDQTVAVHRTQEEAERFRQKFPNFEIIEFGTLPDSAPFHERLNEAVERWNPDWIVHCAAWTDVDGCEANHERAIQSNARSCLEVAAVADRHRKRVLSISTDYVFDGTSKQPYREFDQTNPISFYGVSKALGERYIQVYCRSHLIVRTAWLFGPHGKNFVRTIYERLQDDIPVQVVDDQRGSPTLTTDLAVALRRLADLDAHGICHVVNSGEASWYEMALEVAAMVGKQRLVAPITTQQLGRPAPRPSFSVLDASRHAALVGTPLRPWRAALTEYVASLGSEQRRT
jgi:dTDP-4-dehydrorhamnose reductase